VSLVFAVENHQEINVCYGACTHDCLKGGVLGFCCRKTSRNTCVCFKEAVVMVQKKSDPKVATWPEKIEQNTLHGKTIHGQRQ